MIDFFEKVKKHHQQKMPFVLYCKPNSDTIIVMLQQNDTLYEVVEFTENGFVFSSFDGNKKHLIPKIHSDIDYILVDTLEKDTTEKEFPLPDEIQKRDFEELVYKGILAIKNGDFQKVVVSRKESIPLNDFDLVATFKKIVAVYPTAFSYCFFHPKVGTWLGATPEQLLKVEADSFKTISLAGTQKNTGLGEIVWQSKEIQEQEFVTDYIVAELNKVAHAVVMSEPYSFKAGSIWHIRTDISGKLNTTGNLKEVIQLLHPTPAVCGLPKEDSKKFILENENYDRTFYTGYLGEMNSSITTDASSTDLFVNLRSMQIEVDDEQTNTFANLFMGCGITKDSIPEKEWEESVNKAMTMKKVL